MIELLNLLLLAAVVVLPLEIGSRMGFQRGFKVGRDQGWRECMQMYTEALEDQAERVQEQRALLRHMQADAREAAIERHAAGVARWN